MKRTITLVMLTLLAFVTAQAVSKDEWPYDIQRNKTTDLRFGVTAGLNITQMHYNLIGENINQAEKKNRAGFLAGPTVIFTLPKIGLGVDASVLFDYRSGKMTVSSNEATLTSMNVQLPINLRYGIEVGDLNIFVFAGPQFNVPVGNKTTDVLGADWTRNNGVFSLNFGLGIVAMEKVQVRLGYNLNLKSTGDFYYRNVYRGNVKANALQVALTYLF